MTLLTYAAKIGLAVSKGQIPKDFRAEDYFDVFQLALESRFPRVIEAALDGLYSLIEGDHLPGAVVLEHTALVTNSKYKSSASLANVEAPEVLMDHVVLCIVNCCEENDDAVQAQILNTLFIACTSSKCAIHDTSLVLIVRAFMHLYLTSRNIMNRSTAKSHVMQLVDCVNMNMENAFADVIQKQVTKAATLTPPPQPGAEDSGGEVETKKDIDLPSAPSKAEEGETVVAAARSEGIDGGKEPGSGGDQSPSAGNPERILHNHAAYKNSLRVFRELCKWTTEAPDNNSILLGASPRRMSNSQSKAGKLLALEAIMVTLDKAGPAFLGKGSFIDVVRESLCSALLETCTSHDNEIISISLHIFQMLLESYKSHLKTELEVSLVKDKPG